MEFEWDETKNWQNWQKHHLSFEEAKEIFSGVIFTNLTTVKFEKLVLVQFKILKSLQ
jgi:uncharacterized DUF497 family protein